VWVAEGGLTSTAERAVKSDHYAIRAGNALKVTVEAGHRSGRALGWSAVRLGKIVITGIHPPIRITLILTRDIFGEFLSCEANAGAEFHLWWKERRIFGFFAKAREETVIPLHLPILAAT
jgi:hypothetical protein